MNNGEYYAKLGYPALCRAARKVAENAIKDNTKIPIWENGKVIYISPEKYLKELTKCKI